MSGTLYLGSQKVFPMSTIREDANIVSLTVSPSTSTQVFNATGMTDGYSPVTVNAVTNAIDVCIAPENIRVGVSILNVPGAYDGDIELLLQQVIAGNNPVNVSSLQANEYAINMITRL